VLAHPLDIPKYLRISPEARRKAWAKYKPAAPPPQTEIFTTLSRFDAQRAVEREAKRAARIERAKARKAVPDRIAAQLHDKTERISSLKYKRILSELPTAKHKDALKQMWVKDGDNYRRAIEHGVVVTTKKPRGIPGLTPKPKPLKAPKTPRIVPHKDDFTKKLEAAAYVNGALNRTRLIELAKLNGIWKDNYAELDNGRARMTIGNMLRVRVKRGEQVKWG
jgi:hypothetical protein